MTLACGVPKVTFESFRTLGANVGRIFPGFAASSPLLGSAREATTPSRRFVPSAPDAIATARRFVPSAPDAIATSRRFVPFAPDANAIRTLQIAFSSDVFAIRTLQIASAPDANATAPRFVPFASDAIAIGTRKVAFARGTTRRIKPPAWARDRATPSPTPHPAAMAKSFWQVLQLRAVPRPSFASESFVRA